MEIPDARSLPPECQEALRERVVHAIAAEGMSITGAARTFGVHRGTASRWYNAYRRHCGPALAAGLLRDLKQRGLLDTTLVVWGGEFGRLPISQSKNGRDHNRRGFSVWLAGGGVKRGHVHGATDEFGYAAV